MEDKKLLYYANILANSKIVSTNNANDWLQLCGIIYWYKEHKSWTPKQKSWVKHLISEYHDDLEVYLEWM